MGSTKSVKLNPEVGARIEPVTLDEVRTMLEWGAILDDAIELMWDVGADRSEIVQALRLAADKMDNYREEDQLLARGFDRSRAFVLPDASAPAANRPVVAILAGKRTVSHSRSRIRSAIAHGLNACVSPAEIYGLQGAAPRGG